jgi:quinol-cytochrome oxidoreductase complex cytochrome b subunit
MRGGHDVSINTLYRFFALHVVALPLIIFAVISIHLLLIQRQGMAPPMGHELKGPGMKFFPNFLLRDLLLWLICLVGLMILAVMLPYGPGVPGVEWELGLKANPLQPAYPGIKPEWYFLWIYQLLKEFPPHLWVLEGPQAALLMVSVLMGSWALVPWLDRKARAGKPSPGFTDYGVGAILFVVFLTLMAWDIGGGAGHGAEVDVRAVARVCAWWTLGLAALITAFRYIVYRHRWFLFSGGIALHVALHGLLGMSYLRALVAAAVVVVIAWALTLVTGSGARQLRGVRR